MIFEFVSLDFFAHFLFGFGGFFVVVVGFLVVDVLVGFFGHCGVFCWFVFGPLYFGFGVWGFFSAISGKRFTTN